MKGEVPDPSGASYSHEEAASGAGAKTAAPRRPTGQPGRSDPRASLRHDPSPTIARHLADQMRHSRAAISKTLTRLASRGLVVREPNPTDRRAALVLLTPAGEAAVDAVFPLQLAREAELLEGLGADPRARDRGAQPTGRRPEQAQVATPSLG
ncbi:MarR family transcriptional regulator [Nonomuraea sp. NPDC000554]|uniref:MarR family winged helix-turn-helix transcriptional regulator n=1 Tax=Nonomuraea sp. NPDC000554 TaxID=3154259 RepID=UPI0033333A14